MRLCFLLLCHWSCYETLFFVIMPLVLLYGFVFCYYAVGLVMRLCFLLFCHRSRYEALFFFYCAIGLVTRLCFLLLCHWSCYETFFVIMPLVLLYGFVFCYYAVGLVMRLCFLLLCYRSCYESLFFCYYATGLVMSLCSLCYKLCGFSLIRWYLCYFVNDCKLFRIITLPLFRLSKQIKAHQDFWSYKA